MAKRRHSNESSKCMTKEKYAQCFPETLQESAAASRAAKAIIITQKRKRKKGNNVTSTVGAPITTCIVFVGRSETQVLVGLAVKGDHIFAARPCLSLSRGVSEEASLDQKVVGGS